MKGKITIKTFSNFEDINVYCDEADEMEEIRGKIQFDLSGQLRSHFLTIRDRVVVEIKDIRSISFEVLNA